MSVIKELSPKEFRQMQLIQLDMLKELDRVCRKNEINYCIACGTLLGAVRHSGYIPWDDDADIVMLREDYEKFKAIALQGELDSKICYFQDHSIDSSYLWGYGKLRRTGTRFVRVGQEHIGEKTGVFIDIFPLDDIPLSIVGQMLQDLYCWFWRKVLWSKVASVSGKGLWKYWYKLVSIIPARLAHKAMERFIRPSNNSTPNRVRVLLFPSFGKLYIKNSLKTRYGMPKSWFLNRKEYSFEDYLMMGIGDYDEFLTYMYADYMKLPPVSKRVPHAPVSDYDFAGIHENWDKHDGNSVK